MATARETDGEQAKLWNTHAGAAWVEAQTALDAMLKPFEELLTAEVVGSAPRRVLDVGCGTGATTLAAARRLGADGACVGVDVSEPMIVAARSRAEREASRATFIVADAQTHAFATGGFDMFISRFGVMFFEDPVAAFANLRSAASNGGALRLIAWRSAAENPFMTTAERAAAPLLPNIPPRRTDGGPGQFAFADEARVRSILEASGWSEIELRRIDVACAFAETDLVRYLVRLGPVGQALREASDETRARVIGTVRAAFEPYVQGAEVQFTAACWLICGKAGLRG